MLIDWFTVVAQAVNFLILVWLLKRFLYRPVLAAIDARERKIAAQVADAQEREAQARTEREAFQKRNETLAHEREEILRKASDAADAERQRLLETARQDAQTLRVRLTEVVTKERQELGRQLAARTQAEVFHLARKALEDLAGVGVEGRMVEVFTDHLRALPEAQRKWASPVATGPGAPPTIRAGVVRSAFELKVAQRASIQHAIEECIGPQISLRFERLPQLISGIELTLDGVKLAWSVTDYLSGMEQNVLALTPREPAPSMGLAESPATDPVSPQARHG